MRNALLASALISEIVICVPLALVVERWSYRAAFWLFTGEWPDD